MNVDLLLPGDGQTSLLQEECCWGVKVSYTPALLLHAAGHLRRTTGAEVIRVIRPDVQSTSTRAMIFSWAFGEQIERAAETCDLLIANPATTWKEVAKRFPRATVIQASDCFSTDEPLDISLLDNWPHRLATLWYQTASGCRNRCPYCPWAHDYKQRNPELCASEIHLIRERFPLTKQHAVAVHCNEITGCSDWLKRFCIALGAGVEWRSEANIRNATFEDLKLAREHGLRDVTLGVEALDDELLVATSKGHSVEDAFRVFRWLRELGITCRWSLRQRIGETLEQLDNQIAALRRMQDEGLTAVRISIGPLDCWPGNTRWPWEESHGPRNYPRGMRAYGADGPAIIERWLVIQQEAAKLCSHETTTAATRPPR